MNKLKSKLLETFNSFTSDNNLKKVMNSPIEHEGKIYATDAHVLIRMDKQHCDFDINNEYVSPNFEAVMPKRNMDSLFSINVPFLDAYKTEDEFKEVGEDEECDTCKGSGDVEWEFEEHTKDDDCPICKGSGYKKESRRVKTGKKTFVTGDCFSINGVYVDMKYLLKVAEVAGTFGKEIKLVSLSLPNEPILFEVGFLEILVMPVMWENARDSANNSVDFSKYLK